MVMKFLLLAPWVFLLSAGPAFATSANYADFSSTTGLTLNGDAAQAGALLRLVPNADSKAGTAYLSGAVAFDATTSFNTAFEFNVSTASGDPTDGFSFLLQSDAAGASALGGAGQGLGYTGLSPSVAVVFRGRNPNLIGVITGGLDPADLAIPFQPVGYYTGIEGEFYNQNEFAWIDYDAAGKQLSVFLSANSTKPGTAIMQTTVDVFGTLGPQAYVGFGAGNGGAYGAQDILSWQFNSSPVPEPGTAATLALGAVALALARRRRSR
jgi:hypothetical protein